MAGFSNCVERAKPMSDSLSVPCPGHGGIDSDSDAVELQRLTHAGFAVSFWRYHGDRL
jgi:hypothetical protein